MPHIDVSHLQTIYIYILDGLWRLTSYCTSDGIPMVVFNIHLGFVRTTPKLWNSASSTHWGWTDAELHFTSSNSWNGLRMYHIWAKEDLESWKLERRSVQGFYILTFLKKMSQEFIMVSLNKNLDNLRIFSCWKPRQDWLKTGLVVALVSWHEGTSIKCFKEYIMG